MRPRVWAAFGALALALMLLAPAIAPLPESMDALAGELANGTFRPFGDAFGKRPTRGFSGSLGGFTGQSEGNYLPGAQDVPPTWLLDRDGTGGAVTIDYVFDPDPGAMKRLKAYDRLGSDGASLEVADKRLVLVERDPRVAYDRSVVGNFSVQLRKGEPVPIFSVHPKGYVSGYRTDPPLSYRLLFLRDGADTIHVVGQEDRVVTLNLTYIVASDYHRFQVPPGMDPADYPSSMRPVLPQALLEDARIVLARAGIENPRDLAVALPKLNDYFRSFTEGEIPGPSEVESLYLALALGGKGCCRHRAFAYMVTAQAMGVPTRVVVNEAHAFVEVLFTDGTWHQVNLGGCGSYAVNNPRNLPSLFEQAEDPRAEANPAEGRPGSVLLTTTDITDSPARIVKGERYFVNGTVRTADGRGVPGARVDVYLNETKEAPGRLSGAGVTGPDGRFRVEARVPADAPARNYQLVARSAEAALGNARYAESWSDPPVEVFTPTRFLLPRLSAAAGFPVNVTGRLVDVDGNAVANARILWSAEDAPQPALVTDATGTFLGRVTFNGTGNKSLELRYEGDDHHGPSVHAARVSVEDGALLLPAEAPTLPRGQGGIVRGEVAAAGVQLQGHAVRVTLMRSNASRAPLATAAATTDGGGSFEALLDVPAELQPGVYPVRYEVPTLRLEALGLARVVAPVAMDVQAPTHLPRGEALVVVATLTADNGTRVAGGIVEMTFDGNASTTRALLTNRSGVARFEIPPGALGAGAHVVRVSFVGGETHASAERTLGVEVLPPFWSLVPGWVWILLAALAVLVPLLAWLLRPAGPLRRALPWATARRSRRHLRLAYPDHPPGVPPVAEPGQPLRVVVHVEDREGRPMAARIVLHAPGLRRRARAGDVLEVPVPPEAAALPLRARAAGLARLWSAPAAHDVPALSYRQAIERGFVALRHEARLDASATAGDLVQALAPRLDADTERRLRDLARLFDAADYSELPVDRRDYHAFALARLSVERRLQESLHA